MNDGRLEFVEISAKTKMLTMSGWERFRKKATKVKSTDDLMSDHGCGERK